MTQLHAIFDSNFLDLIGEKMALNYKKIVFEINPI